MDHYNICGISHCVFRLSNDFVYRWNYAIFEQIVDLHLLTYIWLVCHFILVSTKMIINKNNMINTSCCNAQVRRLILFYNKFHYSFMASTFFSTASIGSVSTVILFLMTFLPYIIIISLGAVLNTLGKFIASLSLSTAFCYAWHYIFRTELQEKSLTIFNAFSDDMDDNDFRFGVLMIVFDTFLYAAIGYINKKFSSGEFFT